METGEEGGGGRREVNKMEKNSLSPENEGTYLSPDSDDSFVHISGSETQNLCCSEVSITKLLISIVDR